MHAPQPHANVKGVHGTRSKEGDQTFKSLLLAQIYVAYNVLLSKMQCSETNIYIPSIIAKKLEKQKWYTYLEGLDVFPTLFQVFAADDAAATRAEQ